MNYKEPSTLQFPEEKKKLLATLLDSTFEGRNPYLLKSPEDLVRYAQEAAIAFFTVLGVTPTEQDKKMLSFFKKKELALDGESFVVIRGLPIDDNISETPTPRQKGVFETPPGKNFTSEWMLLGLAGIFGYIPQMYDGLQNGRPFQDLSARAGCENYNSSQGLKVIKPHTDYAFLVHPAECVMLLCPKNKDNIPTLIIPVQAIVDLLGKEYIRTLQQDCFAHTSGNIIDPDQTEEKQIARILHPTRIGFKIRLSSNHNRTKPLNQKARRALGRILSILDITPDGALNPEIADSVFAAHSDPGTVILINNRENAHARPAHNDLDRWLLRISCQFSGGALTP